MSSWEPVIGLEVHVELDTQTKMFCGCAVTKGEPPNTHTCPVCLAHPGALPVVNQRAVEYAARIALVLDQRKGGLGGAGRLVGAGDPARLAADPSALGIERDEEGD